MNRSVPEEKLEATPGRIWMIPAGFGRQTVTVIVTALLLLSFAPFLPAPVEAQSCTPTTKKYPQRKLKTKDRTPLVTGHFREEWDLTQGDLTLSFTYVATGLDDTFPANIAHAVANIGVRPAGQADFDPADGIWMSATYANEAGAFDPNPELDLDDKLILQKRRGQSEGAYDLPSIPPTPSANHRIWFDRDGVSPSQAANPLAIDGATYNTAARYDVVLSLDQASGTSSAAYLRINNQLQGFETDGDWATMELSPAGMTFDGDLTELQLFYAILGYGSAPVRQEVLFENISVTGILSGSCGP